MTPCTPNRILATIGLCVLMLAVATIPALAQIPAPGAATQFDMTGFLQDATLDGACATNAHCGGTLTVNNHKVIVPKETIVILPANALTWQELFAQNPANAGVTLSGSSETGLAMSDTVKTSFPSYEVQAVGNRVNDDYIAGLIYISQQGLNSGQGFINYIDYANAEMRVGGTMFSSSSGARVRINDPATVACAPTDAVCIANSPLDANGVPTAMTGRFTKGTTPDRRFTVDQDNPTVASGTGFPMCLPRQDPNVGDDPLCPAGNRPAGQISISMPPPAPGTLPDSMRQVPMQVGDFITYAGTLFKDGSGDYISAHTISNNIAVYTAPGSDPAYISTEVTILGTGGLTVLGAGEATIRTRFEGMTTDTSRIVHLYGIDVNPDGSTSDRDWGTVGVDPGPAGGAGAVQGRWRFRPPCTATTPTQKACTPPSGGTFLPPTREVRAVVEGAQQITAANGLKTGQFHAPILEYLFPENVPGTPVVPNNFESFPFLAAGGYTSAAGTLAAQLNPWPGASAPPPPPPSCTPPAANAGGPYAIANAGTVTLAGSVSGGTAAVPATATWSVAPTTAGTFSNANSATSTFTGSGAGGASTLTLTASACGTTATSTATVTENAPAVTAPVVNPTATPNPALSGAQVTLNANGVGSGITYAWTQTGGTAVVLSSTTSASPTFNRILPVNSIVSETLSFQVVATNAGGQATGNVTVTINPRPDTITITIAQYRTSKQRLDLTVGDNIINGGLNLTLQPYVTTTGTTFDPSVLGASLANQGNGTYLMTLVGAPEPACANATGANATPCTARPLVVKSNIGGASAPTALTNIRQ